MGGSLYQILYCSRNRAGEAEEVQQRALASILKASRKNNASVGVTGALLYNRVFFAQVLEGEFAAVQTVFERLQLDPRHKELVVLQSGFVTERAFTEWAMVAVEDGGTHGSEALPSNGCEGLSKRGLAILEQLRELVKQQEFWALSTRSVNKHKARQVAA